jgi:peptidoglycan/xylan/chitin deacetylase (PgdA/CDA1 family)
MRLEELARGVRDGNLVNRGVGVTFDDGYQETLHTVKPMLERYEVPATVFATTGTIGRSREFWWDELERILLQPGRLPAHLHLEIQGRRYNWDLGEYADYSRADFHHYRDWNLLNIDDPTPRHSVYRALHELIMYLGAANQLQVLDHLLHWSGKKLTVRRTHRALETDEIVELEKGGLLEVGAHTANHLALTSQPEDVQDQEIKQSKSFLERLLGHQVKSFAYPYGFCSKASVTLSRQAGFEYACAGSSESIHKKSDLFKLPRMEVLDWVGEKFAQRLKKIIAV